MKITKVAVPLLLAVLYAGSIYYMIDGRKGEIGEYTSKLEQAREAVENGVLTDGLAYYKGALAIQPSEDIYEEAGNAYLESGDLQGAYDWYEKEFMQQYPDAPRTYEFGIRVSLAMEDYPGTFQIYNTCKKREAVSDKVEQLIDPIRYKYQTAYAGYEDVGAFSSQNGYAAVKSEGKWGYVSQDARVQLPFQYKSAGVFWDFAAVTDQAGKQAYVDNYGNVKIAVSQFQDETENPAAIKEMGPAYNGMVLAYNGKEWDFYDKETCKKKFGGYQEATIIANGIGAATKDGKKWALIGPDGAEFGGYDYEGAAVNSRGVLKCTNGMFVKQDGSFWLIDAEGKKLNNHAYQAVDAFYENSLAAVKKDGKWLFVNELGEEKDLGSYEEAKSFSNGLAAVKTGGKWGYINMEGKTAIDCIFYDAKEFNSIGVAFVKPTEKEWSAISLYQYQGN